MTAASDDAVRAAAEQYVKFEQNEVFREQISALLAANNAAELRKNMAPRIVFGTAGLRGKMAGGYANMNDLTVLQASQGLCAHMQTVFKPEELSVVIGYDGRHHSERFARIAAAAFASRGVRVHLFSDLVPTPFVSYGVACLKAAAGIMVTASHNPKQDNGYKVYWSNSAQIISPLDAHIQASILANLEPWAGVDAAGARRHALVSDPLAAVSDAYYAAIADKLRFAPRQEGASGLRVAYTAMHGVGQRYAERAFAAFALPPFVACPEQAEPDPEFPTVPFPNPEEEGALALAMRTAEGAGAAVVVANDPDADRLAAAEKQPDGVWRVLNGNELGLLLADWVWTNFRAQNPTVDPGRCAMLASTVSSKAVAAMARAEGFRFEETLTGFKWMGNKADELERAGVACLFAFEVEIGYMVGPLSYDKDGVRGAAVFAEMAHAYARRGLRLADRLEQLYQRYGYFAMVNKYVRVPSPDRMEAVFRDLRGGSPSGASYPAAVGPYPVAAVRDLTTGYDSRMEGKRAVLPAGVAGQMITFYLENGCQVTLRGSGTEPKLKYYVEASGAVGEGGKGAVEGRLREVTAAVLEHLLRPDHYGLLRC